MDPEYPYGNPDVPRPKIARKPSTMSPDEVRSLPQVQYPFPRQIQPGDTMESIGGFAPHRGAMAHSWDGERSRNSTGATIQSPRTPRTPRDPYAYQPYGPGTESKDTAVYLAAEETDPNPESDKGVMIKPAWRRHMIVWIVAFFALVFYTFTVVFAWNASLGSDADTRLLFEDPGRTILILQILGMSTTTLFSELVICTCEMVSPLDNRQPDPQLRWSMATQGTKFTTFMGLSRATPLYGQIYLFLSRLTHGYTKVWLFQRLILYAMVFACSIVLLASISIPISFPVLQTISNGTSGLGEFASTDPTLSFPAFHVTGFLDDPTSVVSLTPACHGEHCFSYFLPGNLVSVNGTCARLTEGVTGGEQICANLAASGLNGGELGAIESVTGVLTNTSSVLGGIIGKKRPGGLLAKRQTNSQFGGLNVTSLENVGNIVNLTEYYLNASDAFHTGHIAYVVYDARGYRLDFTTYTLNASQWPNGECTTFVPTLAVNISMSLCVGSATGNENTSSLLFGVKGCDETTLLAPPCTGSGSNQNFLFAAQMNVSTMRGNTAYDLKNGTILSFEQTSDPEPYIVNATEYLIAVASPFLPSKIVEILALNNPKAATDLVPLLTLSFLTDLSYGSPGGPNDGNYVMRNYAASTFTDACLLQVESINTSPQALTKVTFTVRIAPGTLYTFIILGGLVLLWCLPTIVWSSYRLMANTSGFPEIDFAAKMSANANLVEGLSNQESRTITRKLGGDLDIFVGEGVREAEGDVGSSARVAMVVVDTAPVARLRKGIKYY